MRALRPATQTPIERISGDFFLGVKPTIHHLLVPSLRKYAAKPSLLLMSLWHAQDKSVNFSTTELEGMWKNSMDRPAGVDFGFEKQ
jgi:hypothetical protein